MRRSVLTRVALLAAGLASLAITPAAGAPIRWRACTEDGFQCATVKLPLNYAKPRAGSVRIALTRLPASDRANRIGSLFVNYGGPGGSGVDATQRFGAELFAGLTDRFDLVGFDPRGVGASTPSIDCKVNPETTGIYAQPFATPETLRRARFLARNRRYVRACDKRNGRILAHVSTADVARDLDRLRAMVGDRKLTYLGFSYGTFLGATYAALFPHRMRALVLDGALDASGYVHRPTNALREQTGGFERALGRYFAACAANPTYCTWTGGGEPETAFDGLVERARRMPIAAPDDDVTGGDARAVDGDDILNGALNDLYAKQQWPELTQALNRATTGDASLFRAINNAGYGREADGGYDAGVDRYFTIGAADQRYGRRVQPLLDVGASSWATFDHFWFNSGYAEVAFPLYPVKSAGSFGGSFKVPRSASPPLVVGTVYDPATVYRQARRLTAELGNARLLTMNGDGHTAYGANSPCINAAINAYVIKRTLPPKNTVCQQEVAFPPPPQARRSSRAARAYVPRPGARPRGRYAAPLAGLTQ